MGKYTLDDIIDCINEDLKIIGKIKNRFFINVKPISEADKNSLVWVNPTRKDKQQLVEQSNSEIIICDSSIIISEDLAKKKCFIIVENPKLVFIKIVNSLFVEQPTYEIHPSAIIHKEAVIAPNVHIGPLSYIGKVTIKEGTVIYGNVHIKDNVEIGRNVIIQAGCIIGGTGINFVKDKENNYHDFPHLYGVIIEDDVEIQALNVIDRGVLNDTIIGRRTKIDSYCYVAHNCKIGEENIIIGKTMISGSVTTGNNCWFGPATVIRDGLTIGNRCFTGMGSVVVASLNDDAKVMGNPAKPINEFKKLLMEFKHLINKKKIQI